MTRTSAPQAAVRPFLKWAGGKRQLLPELRRFYPTDFRGYFEPFTGSAAVFFDLYNRGLLVGRPTYLVDNNPDLIGCYAILRDHPDAVIHDLQQLADVYRREGSKFYYDVRDRRFNPARAPFFDSTDGLARVYTPELAAMLIFLNRTGFNGLFRLNSKGEFNVPEGRYTNPNICDSDNLRRVSQALKAANAELIHGRFDSIARVARPDDFLYFDPPYAPLSKTSRFTSYTAEPFGPEEQARLHALLLELSARGCHVVVSNSAAAEIRSLYGSRVTRKARLRVHTVQARRAINSKASGRGIVDECILTNVRGRAADSLPRRRAPAGRKSSFV
jgi:DNA adenine methylase